MLDGRSNSKSKARSGVAATELAIVVAPLLAFIVVAGTDFARAFNSFVKISSCARNGALYGCQDTVHSQDTTGIQTAAKTDAGGMSPLPGVSSSTGNDASSNPYVAVTATYTFTTLINYPLIPHTMNLSRTVQMRVVQSTPN